MILGDKSMLSKDEMHAGEPFCVHKLFLSQTINNFLALGKRKRLDVGLRTSKWKHILNPSRIYLNTKPSMN